MAAYICQNCGCKLSAAQTQWRPIATAPEKEGSQVLLAWPYWSTVPVYAVRLNGYWHTERSLHSFGHGPTHWMPLPEMPSEESEAHGD